MQGKSPLPVKVTATADGRSSPSARLISVRARRTEISQTVGRCQQLGKALSTEKFGRLKHT